MSSEYRRLHCLKTYKWQIPLSFIACTVHPNIFCFYKINSTELRGKNILLQNGAGYLLLLVPLYLRYEWLVTEKNPTKSVLNWNSNLLLQKSNPSGRLPSDCYEIPIPCYEIPIPSKTFAKNAFSTNFPFQAWKGHLISLNFPSS